MAKVDIVTPVGTVMFPNFFTPRPRQQGGTELVYNCMLVFDPKAQQTEAYKALKKAIAAEAKEFFKGQVPGNARNPLINAGANGYDRKYEGVGPDDVFIRPWSKFQPQVIDAKKNPILIEGDVWAGQLFRVSVTPMGYNNSGNAGVLLMLNNAQQAKYDMPRLDGRKSAESTFDELEDAGAKSSVDADDESDFFN